MSVIAVHPEVEEALRTGRAVVALETAVVTHGLPREPLEPPVPAGAPGWDADRPLNLATARAMRRAVREGGAVPATVGVIEGTLHLGLEEAMLQRLAENADVRKASAANLAAVMAAGDSAGTTVSATLTACGLVEPGPIRVLATGGIGGVHHGWTALPDISADVSVLATTPVCVVCTGAKSILDLPATVELLETLGIPLVGYQTDRFPRFHGLGDDRLSTPQRADDPAAAARICCLHWQGLGRKTGVVLANPVPTGAALDGAELEAAVRRANEAADAQSISGVWRTPFLLAELARLTDGRSLRANIALLLNNARLAAAIAKHLDTPDL